VINILRAPETLKIPWLDVFNQSYIYPEHLPNILAKYNLSLKALLALRKNSTDAFEPYGRKIIYKDHRIEVMLACWSYQAMALPHNHGNSKGLIWFVQGDFTEQHYIFNHNHLQKITQAFYYQENSVVRISENEIHSCCPDSTGLSLHIYSPPITNMKVWDEENKQTLTVAPECGAWVPENKNLILSEVKW